MFVAIKKFLNIDNHAEQSKLQNIDKCISGDIWKSIFTHLEGRDFFRLLLVCKTFNQLSKTSSFNFKRAWSRRTLILANPKYAIPAKKLVEIVLEDFISKTDVSNYCFYLEIQKGILECTDQKKNSEWKKINLVSTSSDLQKYHELMRIKYGQEFKEEHKIGIFDETENLISGISILAECVIEQFRQRFEKAMELKKKQHERRITHVLTFNGKPILGINVS